MSNPERKENLITQQVETGLFCPVCQHNTVIQTTWTVNIHENIFPPFLRSFWIKMCSNCKWRLESEVPPDVALIQIKSILDNLS